VTLANRTHQVEVAHLAAQAIAKYAGKFHRSLAALAAIAGNIPNYNEPAAFRQNQRNVHTENNLRAQVVSDSRKCLSSD
jgi:hypothetical protein